MDKPETRIDRSTSPEFIRTILAIGTSLALLFVWGATVTKEPESQILSGALGTAGIAFFAPMWAAMRGKISLAIALPAVAVMLLAAMQFNVWIWRRASDSELHLWETWKILMPAVPGMFWLLHSALPARYTA